MIQTLIKNVHCTIFTSNERLFSAKSVAGGGEVYSHFPAESNTFFFSHSAQSVEDLIARFRSEVNVIVTHKLFLSLPFHFFALLVVLFPLASWRSCEGNLHNGGAFKAAGNGIVKCIHVFG